MLRRADDDGELKGRVCTEGLEDGVHGWRGVLPLLAAADDRELGVRGGCACSPAGASSKGSASSCEALLEGFSATALKPLKLLCRVANMEGHRAAQ